MTCEHSVPEVVESLSKALYQNVALTPMSRTQLETVLRKALAEAYHLGGRDACEGLGFDGERPPYAVELIAMDLGELSQILNCLPSLLMRYHTLLQTVRCGHIDHHFVVTISTDRGLERTHVEVTTHGIVEKGRREILESF